MTAPRRRRSTTAMLAVTVLGLGATACGARLPGAVRTQAEHAVLTPRNGGAPEPGEPGGVLTNPVATSPAGIPSSGPVTVVPSGGATSPSGNTTPTPGQTNAATPNCSGGTDVGLTATTLTLGEIASLTGPVSGLFQGAVQGGEAFANYVNSTSGGICGRHVNVDVADDGTNCTQDENATQTLAGKAFALSGSFALYDGCGASIVTANPSMSDIHVALDPAADTPTNHFDVSSKLSGFATGAFHYYRQKYGARLDRVGTIVENIPSAISKQKDQVNAAESQGWQFVDSIIEQPTNSNFQNDFIKLCQRDHITAFFELTETAANAATMVLNEQQAGCPKSLLNIIPISYDQAFIADYAGPKSDLDGVTGYSEYSLFFNHDEASHNAEVKTFQDWMQRTYPGQPINLYAMFSWASDRLFQQAAESVNGPLTRKSLMAALRKIHDFDANGLIAPTDPSGGSPHCYIIYQIENGAFERVDDPATGYRCDGHFLARTGG